MLGHSMVPIINKSTCVTKKTVDHIFMNSVTTTKFKIEIALDHFPIFFVTDYDIYIKKRKEPYRFKRNFFDISVEKFKYKWRTVNWEGIIKSSGTNNAYDSFIEAVSAIYDAFFPKNEN